MLPAHRKRINNCFLARLVIPSSLLCRWPYPPALEREAEMCVVWICLGKQVINIAKETARQFISKVTFKNGF